MTCVESHRVVCADGSSHATVRLIEPAPVLDRDFVLLLTCAQPHTPSLWIERSSTGSVATLVSIAPLLDFPETKCECVFVVDRSGSMAGPNIAQARNALNVSPLTSNTRKHRLRGSHLPVVISSITSRRLLLQYCWVWNQFLHAVASKRSVLGRRSSRCCL